MTNALQFVRLQQGDAAHCAVLIKPTGVFYAEEAVILAHSEQVLMMSVWPPKTTVGFMSEAENEVGVLATIAGLELRTRYPSSHDEYTRPHQAILAELDTLNPRTGDMSVTALLASAIAASDLSFEQKLEWFVYLLRDYTFWAANKSVRSVAEETEMSLLEFVVQCAQNSAYRLPNKREMLIEKCRESTELVQLSLSQALAQFLKN